jgi:outer membrane protein insertion porin family
VRIKQRLTLNLETTKTRRVIVKSLGLTIVSLALTISGCQVADQRLGYIPPNIHSALLPNNSTQLADKPASSVDPSSVGVDQLNQASHATHSPSPASTTGTQVRTDFKPPQRMVAGFAQTHQPSRSTSPPLAASVSQLAPTALASGPNAISSATASNTSGYQASGRPSNNAGQFPNNSTAPAVQQSLAKFGEPKQSRPALLSPSAIVRGQSGWVPSNSGSTSAPGMLTDTTPSVTRYQNPAQPSYGETIAPGIIGGQGSIAPGAVGMSEPGVNVPNITAPGGYQPRFEIAPLDVYVQEKRTGRIMLGGTVNTDLGVAGQFVIDERNFDIRAVPRTWSQLFSGYAFRGAGQSFRIELMPGNQVGRYTVNWTTPNLFGYTPYSLSVGGFYFTRFYRDWNERRVGGRVGLGYNVTKDLSVGTEFRGENVNLSNPRVSTVEKLNSVLGPNEMYWARLSVAHDTRDSAFLATEGSLLQLIYDQAFGKFDYPQGQINYSRYFRVRERADGMGRHVLASTWKVGISGTQTPIFENFFAGGFSSMRGFRFRGASPVEDGVQVGGRFMFLGSLEYMMPLTADEMLRGVAFVDYGTVEQTVTMNQKNFRVAPGLGIRIAVPVLGPAPLAFDFSVPVAQADGDQRQLMSFYMGFTR